MTFDYNTKREKLVIPEYGRNVHKMVEHAMQIKDRNLRNQAAKTIINIMGNMNPHLRDVSDFKHKLWDHLAIISNFQLDIDSPYDKPEISKLKEKPKRVQYPQNRIRFKHYGKALELFIEKACSMKDGKEKDELTGLIANHMKKSYLTWNREMVSDLQIISDLDELSGGRLKISDEHKFTETKDILAKNRKKKQPRKK